MKYLMILLTTALLSAQSQAWYYSSTIQLKLNMPAIIKSCTSGSEILEQAKPLFQEIYRQIKPQLIKIMIEQFTVEDLKHISCSEIIKIIDSGKTGGYDMLAFDMILEPMDYIEKKLKEKVLLTECSYGNNHDIQCMKFNKLIFMLRYHLIKPRLI